MKVGRSLVVAFTFAGALYKGLQLPRQDSSKAKNMLYKNGKALVIAHRAGQFEAPENTLIAIETAYKNGASGVEIDLDFTMDNVPVLMHDERVDRTTDGVGRLNDFTFEEVQGLNAAANHPYIIQNDEKIQHHTEKIPTLLEAVESCVKMGMIIDLDIKSNPKQIAIVLKEIQNKFPNSTNQIFITSFYPHYLYVLRKECPEFAVGVIWRPKYLSLDITGKPRYESKLKTAFMSLADIVSEHIVHNWIRHFMGISIVVAQKDALSEHYIKHWKQQNVELLVWTVNNPKQKDYMLNYLNIPVITDSVLNSNDCSEQVT